MATVLHRSAAEPSAAPAVRVARAELPRLFGERESPATRMAARALAGASDADPVATIVQWTADFHDASAGGP